MRDYVYKQLKRGEIRLLHLDPGERGDPLTGSIEKILLTNPTYHKGDEDATGRLTYLNSYDAISYAWGEEDSETFYIEIDGASIVKVNAALHYVLQRIRDRDEKRAFWIDAICIDQVDNNSSEKAEQIRLMPDIYRVAERVQVHLGPEENDSPLAIQLLQHIAKYSEYLDDSCNVPATKAHAMAIAKGFSFPPRDDPKWNAVRKFWERRWFHRIWVIQEFVCATQVDIICGEETIDWRELWLAAKAYSNNNTLIFGGYTRMSQEDLIKNYRDSCEGALNFVNIADIRLRAFGYDSMLFMIWRLGREGTAINELHEAGLRKDHRMIPHSNDFQAIEFHERLVGDFMMVSRANGEAFPFYREPLLSLLYRTTCFRSKYPVDRIYALLALGCDAEGPRFEIDYDEPVDQVCKRFAKAFINKGMCSAVLAMAGASAQSSKSRKNMPSWVPDWTEFVHTNDRRLPMSYTALAQLDPEGENDDDDDDDTDESDAMLWHDYYATKGSTAVFRFDGQDTLVLKGSLVDTISRSWKGTFTGIPLFYEMMLKKYVGQYPTGEEEHAEVIWRTLILNKSARGNKPPEEYANEYAKLKQSGNLALLIAFTLVTLRILGYLIFFCVLRYLPFMIKHLVLMFFTLNYQKYTLRTALRISVLIEFPLWMASSMIAGTLWLDGTLGLDGASAAAGWYLSFLASISASIISAGSPISIAPKWSGGYLQSLSIKHAKYDFAITKNNYAGMFPVSTQPGDRVAVFHGCDVPFLLRPTMHDDKTFRLLGECYVHGIMQGEVFKKEAFPVGEIYLV